MCYHLEKICQRRVRKATQPLWSCSSSSFSAQLSSLSIWKTLKLGKIEGRRRKGTTEDGLVGWHHWLDGHEFEKAPGDGEGWGSLACCSPWGRKESYITERLNNNNKDLKNIQKNSGLWEAWKKCNSFISPNSKKETILRRLPESYAM